MIEKLGNSFINHPHCYEWTLVLLMLVLFIVVGGTPAAFFFGFTLGVATLAQIKRALAGAFHVA